MKNIIKLFNDKKNVFDFDDLKLIFWISNIQVMKNKISYLKSKNIIFSPTRWIYILKEKQINKFELANKIYSPSYISFFSALYYHSIIFQPQNEVYLAYKKSDTKKILDFEIILKNIKKEILLNPDWITNNWFFSIASPERAFLDTIYLFWNINFDNISKLNYKKILELLTIYKSKILEKKAKSYFIK